jgi:hypothetical protein
MRTFREHQNETGDRIEHANVDKSRRMWNRRLRVTSQRSSALLSLAAHELALAQSYESVVGPLKRITRAEAFPLHTNIVQQNM